jgi:hypothetical protein
MHHGELTLLRDEEGHFLGYYPVRSATMNCNGRCYAIYGRTLDQPEDGVCSGDVSSP